MSEDDLALILKMPSWVLVNQNSFRASGKHAEATPRVMMGTSGQADQAAFAFFSDKPIADRFIAEVMPHNDLVAVPIESATVLVEVARSLKEQGWSVIAVDLAKAREGVRAAQKRSLEVFLALVDSQRLGGASERNAGAED
jgi:hypothetical protein